MKWMRDAHAVCLGLILPFEALFVLIGAIYGFNFAAWMDSKTIEVI